MVYFPFLAGSVGGILKKSNPIFTADIRLEDALLSWGRDLSPFMTPIIFMMVVTHAMLMVISLPERLVSLRHKCVINAAVVIFQWCVYGYLMHLASSPPEAIYFIMVTPMIMFLSLAIMPNSHLFNAIQLFVCTCAAISFTFTSKDHFQFRCTSSGLARALQSAKGGAGGGSDSSVGGLCHYAVTPFIWFMNLVLPQVLYNRFSNILDIVV